MITARLQIVAVLTALVFLVILFLMLRKNRLALKYSLLWIFSGVVMLLLALVPGLLDMFSGLLGVYSSVNALFAVLLLCGLLLMISFTVIISKGNREIVRLTQQTALLEKRIRELEAERKPETDREADGEKTPEGGKDP